MTYAIQENAALQNTTRYSIRDAYLRNALCGHCCYELVARSHVTVTEPFKLPGRPHRLRPASAQGKAGAYIFLAMQLVENDVQDLARYIVPHDVLRSIGETKLTKNVLYGARARKVLEVGHVPAVHAVKSRPCYSLIFFSACAAVAHRWARKGSRLVCE